MQTTHLRIPDMDNLNCMTHVQKALEAVPGVRDVEVILDEGANITHEGASEEAFIRAVRAAANFNAEVGA